MKETRESRENLHINFLEKQTLSIVSSKDAVTDDAGKKTNEEPANEGKRNEGYANSTNKDSTVNPSVSTAEQIFTNDDDLPTDPLMPNLEDTGIFRGAYDDEDVGAEADLNNLVIPEYPSWIEAMQEELLQFKLQKVWTLVDLPKGKRAIGTKWVYRNMKDERGIIQSEVFLAYASFMGLIVYQMDVKSAFLYGTIEEEVYVCQPPSFEDPQFPNRVYKKFDFTTMKTVSIPIETNKALLKDEEAEDVDVHLYRLMIRSLMYLTASRPDIMFAVCACARFQVTPKVLHLHAVKRIFRYLKGQPKLGLWYPRDLPFDLEAF
ncbi:putative ribonuclease H-like domain-containing protein [Tanacetum coccineum]